MPAALSGQELVKVLLRVGFVVNRQRGSPIVLGRLGAKTRTPASLCRVSFFPRPEGHPSRRMRLISDPPFPEHSKSSPPISNHLQTLTPAFPKSSLYPQSGISLLACPYRAQLEHEPPCPLSTKWKPTATPQKSTSPI